MFSKKLTIFVFGLVYLFAFNTALGHKNNQHNKFQHARDTLKIINVDTSKMQQSVSQINRDGSHGKRPYIINYFDEAFDHLHNKLVHFPVALSVLAFISTMLGFKWNKFEFTGKYIVLTAAILSIPTVITGVIQSVSFVGDPKEWIVNIHRLLGIISSVILWIWTVFLFNKRLNRFGWIIAVISIILIIITSFYGGILAE